jgi:hypothetical protein
VTPPPSASSRRRAQTSPAPPIRYPHAVLTSPLPSSSAAVNFQSPTTSLSQP